VGKVLEAFDSGSEEKRGGEMTAMSLKDTTVSTRFLKLIASTEAGRCKRPMTRKDKIMTPRVCGQ
jgi:hypothetical protein